MSFSQRIVTTPGFLDRRTVEAALADYLLQVNHRGYRPNRRKVLAVRGTDRTAWLRNAEKPVRWEAYYFIEGELFPEPETTKLPPGRSPEDYAAALTDQIWDQLSLWNGFDFTPTSFGLNYMLQPINFANQTERSLESA
ncbi:MAG: hypothetical protein LBU12_00925 [Deltaproteobacteria bacterium]|nr:hypothetical protein [Deltaproteobacteria bacterium]